LDTGSRQGTIQFGASAGDTFLTQDGGQIMPELVQAYLITFGWALVGSISMGIGIIITIKLFDLATGKVDEWELVKAGNIPIAIILASVILSLGIVVSAAIHP
jgi:uncharacterized membrane protein YjfL (UPF0719 family)